MGVLNVTADSFSDGGRHLALDDAVAHAHRMVAAGADIVFVASAHLGDVLVAQAQVRTAYGRSGVTDVTVTRESDGAVIAEFRGRSRSLPNR